MNQTRRSLLSILAAPAAVAQVGVNTSQIKNLPTPPPNTPYDNWVPVPFTGAINGSNPTFALGPGSWRKIRIYLNGVLQYQAAEQASGAPSNYTWTGPGSGGQFTFSSPIPQPANGTIQADALYVEGTL
jgi:hypothetical protein